jgi:hypothetical protein
LILQLPDLSGGFEFVGRDAPGAPGFDFAFKVVIPAKAGVHLDFISYLIL